MNNILTTCFAVCLLIAVAFVVVGTTQAEGELLLTEEQQSVMKEYDQVCPFTAAERADLLSTDSIRQYVEFVDVYCDEEKNLEIVTIKYIGTDIELSKQKFDQWREKHNLELSDLLVIKEN